MTRARPDDVHLIKSYRYLRISMVGLLLALAVAVFHQTVRQGSLLASISAYYYTPARAIFVGVLVAVGVCMIALKGTTEVEDVLLNLGGMLAPIVAVVPTGRGEDHEQAVRACRESEGGLAAGGAQAAVDCPSVRALVEETQASIDNNMVALLSVGAVGLLLTLVLATRNRARLPSFRLGYAAAVAVLAGTAALFLLTPDWFTDNAHYVAAVGLFLCIVGVAVANALRHRGQRLSTVDTMRGKTGAVVGAVFSSDRYAVTAVLMVTTLVVGVVLLFTDAYPHTVFWLEAALLSQFAAFWVVQTAERWQESA